MPAPARVCVFCGSSGGLDAAHARAAAGLGRLLAGRGIGLVYGGASVGLMGILSDAALQAGGEVVGVIPAALSGKEIAHPGLSELHVVGSMQERKALMASLADAFITIPGGLGTLDELFEMLTWAQLGMHRKPVGLLNTAGYFDPLLEFLDRATAQAFLRPQHRRLLIEATDPGPLLEEFASFHPPLASKWRQEPAGR